MKDLLPRMIVPKKERIVKPLVIIPKEKLEQNIVFDNKKNESIEKEQEIIEEHIEVVKLEEDILVEEEIKELEKQIEDDEKEPEPEPEQIPEQIPIKVDKRKGKPSQARLDHLAIIREKAAETRRKKAEYKKKVKEIEKQKMETQPILYHNITPNDVQIAINNALELAENKRLERKVIKKKKKEEEAVLLEIQKKEDDLKNKVMKAIQIPRKNEWEFCFR